MNEPTTIDLLSLVEQHTAFRAIGSANNRIHGTEYYGNCPYCMAGENRFHVYPFSTSPKPHVWCRVCNTQDDHVGILMHFKDMTYVEACQELGIDMGETITHSAPTHFDDDPPPKEWQAMARTFVERATRFLWSGKANHALSYLLKRGLTEATIREAQLGYVPLINGAWFTSPFADWGLTDEMLTQKQRDKGCVKVPNGVLIPWLGDGHVWKLAVKRFEASENEPKYGQVIGSRDALFGIDSLARNRPVLLVEGEMDCLSVRQEAGDLIACVATGSADKARIPLWIARLGSLASYALIGFDNDENGAGERGAAYWIETLPKAMRWPPYSHDTNQMLQDGISIRAWVTIGLEIAATTFSETPQKTPCVIEVTQELAEPFACAACGTDLHDLEITAFIDNEDGKAYCETCWLLEEDELIADIMQGWLPCKDCEQLTGRHEPDGLCSSCFFEKLKVANEKTKSYSIFGKR